eukprot:CAMPEP_0114514676 /NCGR_PEP_ID=MMETSP0109-20121206/16289_1 /TAXON_ID=29199 /ORGANISM="Chlorarachnion reptans, Strain CCCM449" /LENGTH=245 /DNA_ID=CAMNT_0001694749 /DNA_START=51 /DNA_END=788 /DNA_ORIENTATION=-
MRVLVPSLLAFASVAVLAHPHASGPTLSLSKPELVQEELSLCKPCLQISEQGLNLLLNEILNVGVIGGCSKLCSVLKTKAGSTVCDIACAVIGIKEFVKILSHTDLDVFYFCETVKMCPKGKDDAAGKILSIAAEPPKGPAGTKFQLQLTFNVVNATGVGEIHVAVEGPHSDGAAQGFPNTGFKPGTYQTTLTLDTTPQPQANPPVSWDDGEYDVKFDVCQGECYSKHPHSIVLDSKHGNFTIGE